MNVNVKINPAYYQYLKNQHIRQIFYGGSSSGKSYFLAQRCVLDILEGKRNYLILRNMMVTIRRSTFNEIKKAILKMNVGHLFKVNSTDMTITCIKNNKQILFCGCEDPEKLKSITPIDGVITDAWIEEATEISRDAYKQIENRLRGVADVVKRITFSFNPIMKTHWIFTEFFSMWEDDKTVYKDDRLLIVKTTYRDNMFLTQDDINRYENETDPYYKAVYCDGEWGVLGKVIFKNWKVADLTEIKKQACNFKLGLDFGFSDDPTAWVQTHYDRARKTIYILDEIYQCELLNDDLADMLINEKNIGNTPIACDCAEPDRITELCRRGIKAYPVVKGKGSVGFGIDWLKRQTIIIDVNCQHFKNEIQSYQWREDKFGNVLKEPVDKNNHCLTGDTIVNTVNGDIPIRDLVEKTGQVYCYDEDTQQKTISRFYDCRMTQQMADIYEIELEDGRKIKATKEHPVLTQRGWVCVGNLTTYDSIIDIKW